MNRAHITSLLLTLCAATAVQAGERITTFEIGTRPPPEVLTHIDLKAVVTEFLDPLDSGLGKSLGFLIWRETLSAISDQSGAGVILAHTPDDTRLTDLLRQDYHRAALEIARSQRGRMVLWGAITEEDQHIYISSYLSLLTADGKSDLQLEIVPERSPAARHMLPPSLASGHAHTGKPADAPLIAPIPRTLYNFALIDTTRAQLFQRPIVTRAGTRLRAQPRSNAAVVADVPAHTVLQAVGMHDGWFEVRLDDGRAAHVFIDRVDVPPRQIEAAQESINLRAGPGTDHAIAHTGALRGSFNVRNMRYREGKGLWYEIDVHGRRAWVYADLVRPRFSLPAVHFLAGLYRFYGQRHKDAAREFEQFITTPGVAESNVNLASAWQLLGASHVALDSAYIGAPARRAFDEAVRQTPYDPAAYALRALASLDRPSAMHDLAEALRLDDRDPQVRALVGSLAAIADGKARPIVAHTFRLPEQSTAIGALSRQYRIAPATPP